MADDRGYGYQRRRDLPDRLVPVPPQATPISELPRAVADAVKNPRAAVAHFAAQYGKAPTIARIIAQANLEITASGGGGTNPVSASQWYSRINRWCRQNDRNHTTGSFGFNTEITRLNYSLYALANAGAPPGLFKLRCEDVIAGEVIDNTGTETVSGCVHFGLRTTQALATLAPDGPFVGFYFTVPDTVGGGTHYGPWRAGVFGTSGAGDDQVNTGITSEDPHRLTFDIDVSDGTVTFYIDGALVHTVAGFATAMAHAADDVGLSWIIGGGGSGVHDGTVRAGWYMEKINHSVRILDEVA